MSEHNSYGLYYSEPDYIGKIDFILVFLINLNYLSATYLAENIYRVARKEWLLKKPSFNKDQSMYS